MDCIERLPRNYLEKFSTNIDLCLLQFLPDVLLYLDKCGRVKLELEVFHGQEEEGSYKHHKAVAEKKEV